ncbi:hypothetical protein M409DRAFT_22682 [Zasmidium cellare ATCC 36951]|uniref:Uncharacterized protein n=1 Tax=Zasmidium cellare ATCC 36951 TaxID=1080233 RepID=A0A6A6CJD3_ZASCE|nr:uncharacterized protein M409DRAFT_22682 [Zasmidium cellare ATCC 36951]KAF2167255.1 hypothetical protein M409DRAFT_22682 [Zasmidium cellare ATCC 36951]
MPSNSFNPSKDIPSLAGKVILITGGNAGLGKESALQLAHHDPSEIWIASRNLSKAQAAIAEIRTIIPDARLKALQLDLASLESVKSAADEFLRQTSRLDILFLNAGIMSCPPGLSQEGYEIQFGTNHLGHAALVKLLLPHLEATATATAPASDVRVISVSSMAHKYVPSGGIDFASLQTTAEKHPTNDRYGQSKLANILYARELAKRHPRVTSVSVHPGIVKTDLHADIAGNFVVRAFSKCVVPLIGLDVEQGARNQLWAATAKKGVESGEYYTPVGVKGGDSAFSRDQGLAGRLWEWTQTELAKHGI